MHVNRLYFSLIFEPPRRYPRAAVRTFHIPGRVPGFVIRSLYVVRVVTVWRSAVFRRSVIDTSLFRCLHVQCVYITKGKKKSFVNTSFPFFSLERLQKQLCSCRKTKDVSFFEASGSSQPTMHLDFWSALEPTCLLPMPLSFLSSFTVNDFGRTRNIIEVVLSTCQ